MSLMEIRMSMDAREINEMVQDQLEDIRQLRLMNKNQAKVISEMQAQEDKLRDEIARLYNEVGEHKRTIEAYVARETEA